MDFIWWGGSWNQAPVDIEGRPYSSILQLSLLSFLLAIIRFIHLLIFKGGTGD